MSAKPRLDSPELSQEEIEEYLMYFRMIRVSKSKREPILQDYFKFIDIKNLKTKRLKSKKENDKKVVKIQKACRREVKEFKEVEKKILSVMPPVTKTEDLPYVSLAVGENKHLNSNFSKQN